MAIVKLFNYEARIVRFSSPVPSLTLPSVQDAPSIRRKCPRPEKSFVLSVSAPDPMNWLVIISYRYTDNGGSILGISSANFAVLAGDTRSTNGYSINSRHEPKVFRIGSDDRILLAVVGFAADGRRVKERLDIICQMYQFEHGKPIGVAACAHRLSTLLYEKRFFPYMVQAILIGLDGDGRGALYSYDPAGSYKKEQHAAAGAAASLLMPFLDNQVAFNNQYLPTKEVGAVHSEARPKELLSRNAAVELIKDTFDNVTERHIEVGDGLQLMILTKEGIEEMVIPLKKD